MEGSRLTVGKVRGLQQLADEQGIFAMLALDHRQSLRRALNPMAPAEVPHETMVELKLLLTRVLAPETSAVLLDPVYGAAQAIGQGALPRSTALIVSLEASGYEGEATARQTVLMPHWDVTKIKQMGASAVKLLVYYRPDAATAAEQEWLVASVGESCRVHDIPLLLEPLSYSLDPARAPKGSQAFAEEHPTIVEDTARRLAPLGVDILKAEFPADLRYDPPEVALSHARRLTEASPVPWVLLSAGADFPLFREQLEIASRAGASGFLAGRAIWQEITRLPVEEREEFASTVARERLQTLVAIANAEAHPYRPTTRIPLDWLETYGRQAEVIPAPLAD